MANESGTVWVAFNGELFEYPEIRRDLISRGHHLATRSDTELWVDVETRLVLRWLGPEGPSFEVVDIEVSPLVEAGFFEIPSDAAAILEPLDPRSEHPLTGLAAPSLSGELLGGGSFVLAEHVGERVVLLVWASWCPPCLDDMEAFHELAEERTDLTLVTVLIADEPEAASEVMLRAGWTLPVLDLTDSTEENYLAEVWRLYGFPQTVLIDSDGTVASILSGSIPDGMHIAVAAAGW